MEYRFHTPQNEWCDKQNEICRYGKKNIYLCETCGHGFVSQDVDKGITPFTTHCINSACNGHARSLMYAAPQRILADISPAIEWYKPTFAERKKMPATTRRHCENDGLIARKPQ